MPHPRQHADHAARQRAYRDRQAAARREERQAKGLPTTSPIATLPSRARWQALLAQAQLSLETLRDELQAYYDARTQTWQESDRAVTLAEQRDTLEQVLDDLDAVPPF